MPKYRIATRSSPLALWQAEFVSEQLRALSPEIECELLPMTTTGDRWLAGSLAERGGKGLFVKELETALLDGRADLAVHSLKDVPMHLPAGLQLGAYLPRHEPADAIIGASSLDALPRGARVGTSSQRRRMLLAGRRPDLDMQLLRGNINTRLAKFDAGEYAAIILAAAGLKRLQMAEKIGALLPTGWMIPAPGQGILAVETRADDAPLLAWLGALNDSETQYAAEAERALSATLGGSCALPLAGHCRRDAGNWQLDAALGLPDGSQSVTVQIRQGPGEAQALGVAAAEALRVQGGDAVLRSLGMSVAE